MVDTVLASVGMINQSVASGSEKWSGMAVVGARVCAAPHNAEAVLVLDTATFAASGIETSTIASGPGKWRGIVALGVKLYAAPYRQPPQPTPFGQN